MLDGSSAGSQVSGLTFGQGSSGSTVQSLVINGFGSGYGIDVETSNILITGNYLGTNAAGNAAAPNQEGVYVGSSGCTIGGTAAGTSNLISGNTSNGIDAEAACLVEGNYIGTDVSGTVALANGNYGIYVNASGPTIGGTTTGAGNLISGNSSNGININTACLVEGNLIGTDASGTVAIGNGRNGINIAGDSDNDRRDDSAAANVISGNVLYGVYTQNACLVEGNLLGLNEAGTAAIANSIAGVGAAGSGATIGGATSGSGNVISGNVQDGIAITAPSVVEGNLIGTNPAGTAAIPNTGPGVLVAGNSGTTIGGTTSSTGNVISGNTGDGIKASVPCLIQGNVIGTDASGTSAIANGGGGINTQTAGITIGGTTAGAAAMPSRATRTMASMPRKERWCRVT